MKEVKLGLIHIMTRANRINPPSLEEGRGWWGFKLRQAYSESNTLKDRLQTVSTALRYGLTVTETWSFSLKPKNRKTTKREN